MSDDTQVSAAYRYMHCSCGIASSCRSAQNKIMHSYLSDTCKHRVSWKVIEFEIQIFRTWKSWNLA